MIAWPEFVEKHVPRAERVAPPFDETVAPNVAQICPTEVAV